MPPVLAPSYPVKAISHQ